MPAKAARRMSQRARNPGGATGLVWKRGDDRLVGATFGEVLRRAAPSIVCFTETGATDIAHEYLSLLGCPRASATVVSCDTFQQAHAEICELTESSKTIPLLFFAAATPSLKDMFFRTSRVCFFLDHHYSARSAEEPPELFCVGSTYAAVEQLLAYRPLVDADTARRARRERAQTVFGYDRLDDGSLLRVLGNSSVSRIRMHGLGPPGTNISQACHRFLDAHKLEHKAEVIVHGAGVGPPEYADIAAREVQDGVIPLHVECAVFYGLGELFRARANEVVFAGHHYMPLDAMQLAAHPSLCLRAKEPASGLRIVSHPSPAALAEPLVEEGASLSYVSSNAAAAGAVQRGEADMCITTDSAGRSAGLVEVHRFGSPMMIFTIGTPLSVRELRAAAKASQPHGVSMLATHQAEKADTPEPTHYKVEFRGNRELGSEPSFAAELCSLVVERDARMSDCFHRNRDEIFGAVCIRDGADRPIAIGFGLACADALYPTLFVPPAWSERGCDESNLRELTASILVDQGLRDLNQQVEGPLYFAVGSESNIPFARARRESAPEAIQEVADLVQRQFTPWGVPSPLRVGQAAFKGYRKTDFDCEVWSLQTAEK
jgi:hypothetical protein